MIVAARPRPRWGEIWAFVDHGGRVAVHRYLGTNGRGLSFRGDGNGWRDPEVTPERLVGRVVALEAGGSTVGLGVRLGPARAVHLWLCRKVSSARTVGATVVQGDRRRPWLRISLFRVNALTRASRAIYDDPVVASRYGSVTELQRPEVAILERVRDEVQGQPVLDIGVGGGRTVAPLRALASRYVGLDYSEAMVDVARRQHPGADIRTADVRNLRVFEAGSFRLAVFSFNGIDSIEHEDRLHAFREVWRVVEPGGLFVFSSHNDAYRPALRKLWLDEIQLSRNPLQALARLLGSSPLVARRIRNHLRHRRDVVRTDDYAIRCDGGHDHTVLCYYVTRGSQIRQLTGAGFVTEAVYDLEGREAADDCAHAWLYYVARKVATDPPVIL